ncbi:hypothetical protein JCM16303_003414 [Sporobolomyces ruberrimus]
MSLTHSIMLLQPLCPPPYRFNIKARVTSKPNIWPDKSTKRDVKYFFVNLLGDSGKICMVASKSTANLLHPTLEEGKVH